VSEPSPVLELSGVTKRYGSLYAVDDVSLTLGEGARHALIGPNGAGKSTLFHLISGTVKPTKGKIVFAGADISRLGVHRRTRLGVGRTFQQSSLFDGLTARENVRLAVQRTLGHARGVVRPAAAYRDVALRTDELLGLAGLEDRAATSAVALSHGHRRQLEVALALATAPSLLLMDEPTAGMSRDEAGRFLAIVGALPPSLTIMLVEHDMDVVFGVATDISVLDAGRLIASGPPEAIRASAVVQEAYLGPGERMEELFISG
jgi:branched-chain amino acid transport system ATP-binding protein